MTSGDARTLPIAPPARGSRFTRNQAVFGHKMARAPHLPCRTCAPRRCCFRQPALALKRRSLDAGGRRTDDCGGTGSPGCPRIAFLATGDERMSGWETTVNTGNPDYDRTMIEQYRQQAAANGMDLQVQPLPTGGYHIKGVPMGQAAAPQAAAYGGYGGGYGAPAQSPPAQQYQAQSNPGGYGQPAYATAGAPPAVVSGGSGALVAEPDEAASSICARSTDCLRSARSSR
jgi:hypothetical protein